MNTEEKAKAYDEALKRAMKELQTCGSTDCDAARQIFRFFPQLRESEDERIRKSILHKMEACKKQSNFFSEEEISWLEKQKELPFVKDVVLGLPGLYFYDGERMHFRGSLAIEEKQKESLPIPDKFSGLKSLMLQYLQSAANRKDDTEIESDTDLFGRKILDYVWKYDEKQKEQKPILEVFGFKVGDAVRLKDGDGRKHIIKSFEEVEGLHGPNFYHVEFEDDSARDSIYPGEEYPNGYYTQMEKFEKEQKPAEVKDPFSNANFVRGYESGYADAKRDQKLAQTDDEKEYVRTLKNLLSTFICDKQPANVVYYQRVYDWLDGRHIEQKPMDYEAELKKCKNNPLYFYDKYVYVKQKPVEYLSKDKVYAIMNKLTELSTSELIPLNSDEYKKINEITSDVRSLLDYPIEQKPAEWDDYTKTNLGRAIQIIKDARGTLHGYQTDDGIYECDKAIEALEHFLYRGLEIEKSAEWSEEDEEMLNSCISSIEESKENRYAYKETDGDTSYDHEIDWLKSLRPQPRWKPSKEQMADLEFSSRLNSVTCPNLKSLYNDLKKL